MNAHNRLLFLGALFLLLTAAVVGLALPPPVIAPAFSTFAPTPAPTLARVTSPTPDGAPALYPTPTPGSTGLPSPAFWEAPRPGRDLYELTARLGYPFGPPASPTPRAAQPAVGEQEDFWIGYQQADAYRRTRATLVTMTDHAYYYLEDGLGATPGAMEQTARDFERRVYPSLTRYFGPLDRPGPNGDVHLTVLVARLQGVNGYWSDFDQHPRSAHPYSNERHIIYLNGATATVGTPAFTALVAHEFQHLLRGIRKQAVDNWINEGSSEMAMRLVLIPSES